MNGEESMKFKDISLLEQLAKVIIVPKMARDYYRNLDEETEDKSLEEYFMRYRDKLTKIAFRKNRDYQEFRRFFNEYSVIFMDHYTSLKNITNEQINYILSKVREERVKLIEKMLNETAI